MRNLIVNDLVSLMAAVQVVAVPKLMRLSATGGFDVPRIGTAIVLTKEKNDLYD